MVRCPKCRAENPDTQRYCGECGTRLDFSGERPESDKEKAPLGLRDEISLAKTFETPAPELATGTLFAGRYQIIEELGHSGMGRVYRALDKKINEEVAIKVIRPEIASERKTLERFRNELKTARRYQTAEELLEDVRKIEKGMPITEKLTARKPLTAREITVTLKVKKLVLPAALLVAAIIIGVIIWKALHRKPAVPPPVSEKSVAVLPFVDLSPDKSSEHLADGFQLWSERYDWKMEDIFAIQDAIARALVDALKVEMLGEKAGPLVKPGTKNLEAYNLYLQGRHFQKALEIIPDYYLFSDYLAITYVRAGNIKESLRILKELEERPKKEYVPPAGLAALYGALREGDKAFDLLDKAYNERDNWVTYLKGEPIYDPLRSGPRFAALLKKIGLEK